MTARPLLKYAALVFFVVGALTLTAIRLNGLRQTGDAGARVWFYDESAKRLYAVPADTLPPHKGVGGKSRDGVRAVVVLVPGGKDGASSQRIAYLETYSPALKALLEQAREARAGGRPFNGKVPARDSDFFQTNTLVRRVEETVWHPISSPEGQAIMSEWRSWGGPGGRAPAVCVP
jgi:hypothetical protein